METANHICNILCSTFQKCSAKEVCIGVLEQLDREATFSLERFVVLLDILRMGMLVLIIIKGF